ncbi:MAG: hypothetical protein JKP90_00115 [Desulfofustis sp. PB-SRB1]|nr:hypothetical protein [Desulfofustis sp. PB-SRB1]
MDGVWLSGAALLLSVFVFGVQVLFIAAVSVLSCMAVEAASQKMLGRPLHLPRRQRGADRHAARLCHSPRRAILMPALGGGNGHLHR